MQHLAARQFAAETEPGVSALEQIEIADTHSDALVEWLSAVQHDHRRHELRYRSDRGHGVRALVIDGFAVLGIENQHVRRSESELLRIEHRARRRQSGSGLVARPGRSCGEKTNENKD